VIPLLEVAGTPAAVGEQIGEACRSQLIDEIAATADLARLRERVRPFDAAMRTYLPRVAAEVDGCARGAGVDPIDLVVYATEELYGGCTDVAARPPATAGDVIVAHTNDLHWTVEDRLVAIHRRVKGEPELFTIGVGPFLSAGMNGAGLALGGNQLDANDERPGIPRLLLVRALLAEETSAGALAVALHPQRASSYNNLIAHRDGTLVNVEASATAVQLLDAEDGTTAHSNHYTAPEMERFELDPAGIADSRARLECGRARLAAADRPIGEDALLDMLSDPGISRSEPGDAGTRTVFWCVMNPSQGRIDYGKGRPSERLVQQFCF
jgi:isopenicillin-N N-acyltransferase-like protein